MSKQIPFSRNQFRIRRRRFLKRNWRRLAILLGSFVAVGLGASSVMDGYALGALHTSLLLGYLGMVTLVFLATNTGAIGQLAGAWGEEQTTDVLKKARRRGLIWAWVDGVATDTGDIDHFVITKAGGLVAIDSKWRNDVNTARVSSDAHSAQAAARRANSVLRSMKVPVGVTPLIVMWGGARGEVPEGANVGGVDFIAGERLLTWLGGLNHEPVGEASARELQKRVLDFRQRVRPASRSVELWP